MRVRVKYCGGCNPRFDRRAVAERLKAGLLQAEFVEMGDAEGAFEYVVVICGCPAACASHEDLRGLYGKSVISSIQESGELEQVLQSILKK